MKTIKMHKIDHWNNLAKYIAMRSAEICEWNHCTEDTHNCESYAYIAEDGSFVDICGSDYFNGWGCEDIERHGGIACFSLPWSGTGKELRKAVLNNIDGF